MPVGSRLFPILAVWTLMLSSVTAWAQTVSQFEVKEQPLGDALRTVVKQADMNILFDPQLVQGRRAAALNIQTTLDDAIDRLLAGTGLQHQYVDEKTVTVIPAALVMPVKTRLSAEDVATSSQNGVPKARPDTRK